MEHFVQFAISIDDETIQRRLEDYAYNDILHHIEDNWEKSMPKKKNNPWMKYGSNEQDEKEIDWDQLTNQIIGEAIDKHKDEIIEATANKLCESFKRTKAYKTRMQEIIDEN